MSLSRLRTLVRPTVRSRADRSLGQAMMEFALISPIFFLLLLGSFDFGLMMFSIGSARFAAADAARVEAQQGNQPNQTNGCDATCFRLGLGQGPVGKKTGCDADCKAIVSIANSSLETTSLARILEIDITKETSTNGVISDFSPLTANKYTAIGAACSGYTVTYRNGATRSFCSSGATSYPPSSRNVIFGQADILKVDIVYEYDWKAGLMNVIFPEPPLLHASYIVTLEPQGYR